MNIAVVWLPEAALELDEALDWYRAINPVLSIRFGQAIASAVDDIAAGPQRFPLVHEQYRRAGVRRFPYGLIFTVEQGRVVVVACFHSKRHPRRWKRRIT